MRERAQSIRTLYRKNKHRLIQMMSEGRLKQESQEKNVIHFFFIKKSHKRDRETDRQMEREREMRRELTGSARRPAPWDCC